MFTVAIGLIGALVYGGADFFGGLAARRLRSVLVTAIAAATGLALFLVAAPVVGGTWSAEAAGWGVLSGVFGAVSVALLYACLAIGPMSILSPLTALVSAVAPMVWGLLVEGEDLGALGYAGIAIALVAVVLIGFIPGERIVRPTARAVVMAIGAGISIGALLITLDQPSGDSGLVPLIASRAANLTLMVAVIALMALVARARPGVSGPFASPAAGIPYRGALGGPAHDKSAVAAPAAVRGAVAIAVLCGVLDAAANALLLFGLRLGELAVMSVLTAMYPAGTILLAAVVLRERIAPVQWAGLVLALTAGGLFAVA
ncbi:EamA family transporter [Microbacterium sp. DT81.1]|uniref:EamA family transporter n=1 Tax=Microbacterium sp. DT81.1 TaxID=3393413 RepID=UPI003CEDDCF2